MKFTDDAPDLSHASARDRILLTAHALFYRHGVRATGIDRVIGEAGVTKVTFYRHFPSKHDLIRAYLNHRHALWMTWFNGALQRHGGDIGALAPTLAEWFKGDSFRGCAFINVVSELADEMPDVLEIARAHKDDMTRAIAGLLPALPSRQRKATALALAMAVDGVIVRVQMGGGVKPVLNSLNRMCEALSKGGAAI